MASKKEERQSVRTTKQATSHPLLRKDDLKAEGEETDKRNETDEREIRGREDVS